MKLKINFTDFWSGFNKTDNFFWNLLNQHYDLEISENPDVLFFSVFGDRYKSYKCFRIFYTGECFEPNLDLADFSLSFSLVNSTRHLRLPLYVLYVDLSRLLNKPTPGEIIALKSKFCCFVVSNGGSRLRNDFFKKLSKYKKVDSGGRWLNNIGGPVADKINFIKDYKFVISFENQAWPGYTTEKIIEPMLVNSIPIYWGNPLIDQDFNVNSFVNVNDFSSTDRAIEYIISLDQDDQRLFNMLEQPWLTNNKPCPDYLHENILKKMIEVIDSRNETNLAANRRIQYLDSVKDFIRRRIRGERRFY
jgi:succinate dehydrogenase flavin-adding protein (antitoxin of CptAB toxin-antitoxin module)